MEYDLTPYIRQGENRFRIGLHRSRAEELQQGLRLQGERLSGSYLFSQQRRSIADYRIALVPDSLRRFGVLKLEIIARNGYNYEEPVNVAYDIYSPEGKLLDFSDRPVTIAGRSQDTLRFSPLHLPHQRARMGRRPGPALPGDALHEARRQDVGIHAPADRIQRHAVSRRPVVPLRASPMR